MDTDSSIYYGGRDILQAKLVSGTLGEVKFLISRKSCCTQFYRLLEEQVNDSKKSAIFQSKIRENI